MFPKTHREFGLVTITAAIVFAVGILLAAFSGQHEELRTAGPIVAGMVIGLMLGLITLSLVALRVDPWALQRRVMVASGQVIPKYASVTRGTLLYYALCMEELSEAMRPAILSIKAKRRQENQQRPSGPWSRDMLVPMLNSTALSLHSYSLDVRSAISQLPEDFCIELTEELAIELADGVTDLVVVAAGLAESSGLPGAALYEEVTSSNISKANPITGLIDVDPSGKWIKGSRYAPPNLAEVLSIHNSVAHRTH